MKELTLLKQKLTLLLPIHQARVTFIAQFVLALLNAQTCNFALLAQKFKGKAKVDSHYKRIQRFFRGFQLDFSLFARMVAAFMPLDEKWVLCLDRTHWKFGQLHINFLVLGVAYKGVCIPLFWTCQSKAGNSNTRERLDLICRFVRTFGVEKIDFR